MIARAATPEEREALALDLAVHLSPDARGIVAVNASGEVRGGILYDGWTPNAVWAHVLTRTPLAWRALRGPAFGYPFGEGGRTSLFASIRDDNAASVKAVKHLGMREVARLANGWSSGVDVLIFEMRPEWLKGE